jgi:hypothetical protein
MAMAILGAPLFGQTEEPVDKVSVELEFNAPLLTADSEGVVDSLHGDDTGLDGTKFGLSYEDELWGASISLTFANEGLRFLNGEIGEMFAEPVLSLDELYGWVKPFGEHFKFTGGVFENTDGVADYTDDIDEFGMGVFFPGEGEDVFAEPEETRNGALANGFLTEAAFGPVTLQLLLSSNYSGESASDLINGLVIDPMNEAIDVQNAIISSIDEEAEGIPPIEPIDASERFFRIGGRVIVDAGIGTFAALFKTFQWPLKIVKVAEILETGQPGNYPGSAMNWTTFGAYFDLTAVENLGVSLGYTGVIPTIDASDYDNVLYSGVDLRATWTGIEGLSLSTHNNVSFAQGAEKEWSGTLGKDASFFTLYNAIGATKELTDKFSVNGVVSNLFSKTDLGDTGKIEYDSLGIAAKFIAKVSENAEFNAGLRLDFEKMDDGNEATSLTTFSIPVGISLKF